MEDSIMAKVIQFMTANEDGEFEGFTQIRDGSTVAEYRTASPFPVKCGDILQVEITSPTTCAVLNVRRASPPLPAPMSWSRPQSLLPSRPRTKRQKPLSRAEMSALNVQLTVEGQESSERWLQEMDEKQRVRALFAASNLSPREERVIRLRFMRDLELRTVGEQFGVTPDRIRQIECRGLRKMKRAATVLARQGVI
jgi:RNA polymerase sigma factor (sigma-70 family)